MTLLLASNNKHKVIEIKSILKNRFDKIVTLEEEGIVCNPEENGTTFYDNALIKATEVAKYTSYTVLADDTGLCVDALNGEPGTHSARYSGDHDNAKNRAKLLEKLKNTNNRTAHFETAVVLRFPNGQVISASGRVDGYILKEEQGTNGFGYDSIFYSNELAKCFGIATDEEKNSVSHRARALQSLVNKLEESKLQN